MVEYTIPQEILDDLSSRFIINVPEEERKDLVRLCFQVELAHWFYLDFYCTEENKALRTCGIKEFATNIFQHIPFLKPHVQHIDTVIEQWRDYKQSVPTYGGIVLNEDLTKVLLVQSYWAKHSWGFPKGKVNEDEDPSRCAIREVLEETGFNIAELIDKHDYIESTIHDQLIRLYIVSGVSMNTTFKPRTRKEIKNIEWFSLADLPNNKKDMTPKVKMGVGPNAFFMVVPFVKRLKRWVADKQQRDRNPSGTRRYRLNSLGEGEPVTKSRRQQQLTTQSTQQEIEEATIRTRRDSMTEDQREILQDDLSEDELLTEDTTMWTETSNTTVHNAVPVINVDPKYTLAPLVRSKSFLTALPGKPWTRRVAMSTQTDPSDLLDTENLTILTPTPAADRVSIEIDTPEPKTWNRRFTISTPYLTPQKKITDVNSEPKRPTTPSTRRNSFNYGTPEKRTGSWIKPATVSIATQTDPGEIAEMQIRTKLVTSSSVQTTQTTQIDSNKNRRLSVPLVRSNTFHCGVSETQTLTRRTITAVPRRLAFDSFNYSKSSSSDSKYGLKGAFKRNLFGQLGDDRSAAVLAKHLGDSPRPVAPPIYHPVAFQSSKLKGLSVKDETSWRSKGGDDVGEEEEEEEEEEESAQEDISDSSKSLMFGEAAQKLASDITDIPSPFGTLQHDNESPFVRQNYPKAQELPLEFKSKIWTHFKFDRQAVLNSF